MTAIKFAVAGCGHIGKRHAAIIAANAECELVALCDEQPAAQLGIEKDNVPFFNTVDALLESGPAFDVLSVATPNGLHEAHALKGIQAGRHVVIEKPMALTRTGCEKIIFEALHHNRQVFCIMQNRYSPPAAWVKQILQQGLLGDIYMVQVNCYWNRDERYYNQGNWHGTAALDGGTLFTQFSHFVDILYWLFGDIENIQARFKDFNHQHLTDFEDSGFITFDFVNGGMGCFNYSTSVWNENLESSLTIIAQNGTVKIAGQYMNEVQVCDIKNYTLPQLRPVNPPNNYGPYTGTAANHQYVFENIVDVLQGRAPITTNALEGMKVVEMIERIYSLK
jgi:UDP-N-acetyl-2-amino-2-deoxyglucuronate dehydrogenase